MSYSHEESTTVALIIINSTAVLYCRDPQRLYFPMKSYLASVSQYLRCTWQDWLQSSL